MLVRSLRLCLFCFAAKFLCGADTPPASPGPGADIWRSSLYPADWRPGYSDATGRFLHDFSYAGYHRGEVPIPDIQGPVIDVTQPPHLADPTGKTDSTAAIQSAIDFAGQAGGGVVYVPEGTYLISPGSDNLALKIRGDHVVLRGAGVGKTFLLNETFQMRGKCLIEIRASDAALWIREGRATSPLVSDLLKPALELPVADASAFAPGDLVAVRSDFTERFIDEHGMTGKWTPDSDESRTLLFCRRVTAVDKGRNILMIDSPTRYALRTADNARVVKLSGHMISESGIEDFSIGMKQHPGEGLSELDHGKPGTVGYDVNQCHAVMFYSAENCWMRRVNSYRPEGNPPNVHLLDNGVKLTRSRFVTVEDCDLRFPQYRGGGGDGYLYIMQGQECLVSRCRAEGGRHNYDFGTMRSSGNVLLDCLAKDGVYASDFHMWLSVANLIDNMTCDGNWLEAKYRPWGNWGGNPVHGVTTTQSVFWNTNGLRYPPTPSEFDGNSFTPPQVVVESRQFGDGYVIGTRGPASAVASDNFVEGVGKGASLEPASLYRDQLRRRLKMP